MENIRLKSSRSNQKGAAMMETVVSLFVLAIGLLGTLSMQVKGVNSNQRASQMTEANMLAADMVDRILVFYNGEVEADDDYAGIDTSNEVPEEPDCSAGCTAAQQVQLDIAQWGSEIERNLPGGVGTVEYEAGLYTVKVFWDLNQTGDEGRECNGATGQLACFSYELRI